MRRRRSRQRASRSLSPSSGRRLEGQSWGGGVSENVRLGGVIDSENAVGGGGDNSENGADLGGVKSENETCGDCAMEKKKI